MDRRHIAFLVGAFVVTRMFLGWYAVHPWDYGPPCCRVHGDVELYARWGFELVNEGEEPYRDIRIEYPPGSIPLVAIPAVGQTYEPGFPPFATPAATDIYEQSYRARFVFAMVALDIVAMLLLVRLARRWGSMWGPWLWVVGLAALGPVAYLRLDLIVAVATIVALERASVGAWLSSGAAWGLGIVAKLYPLLLIPLAVVNSRRRGRLIGAAAAVIALLFVPYFDRMTDIAASVFDYHSERGIQVESTWALGLLLLDRFGYETNVVQGFGSFNVAAAASNVVKLIADVLTLAVVAVGAWMARWRIQTEDASGVARLVFAVLAVALAVSTVFSPQYVIWLLALGAVALSRSSSASRQTMAALVVIALITQAVFPFVYRPLLRGEVLVVLLLLARNLGLLALGAWTFFREPSPAADASPLRTRTDVKVALSLGVGAALLAAAPALGSVVQDRFKPPEPPLVSFERLDRAWRYARTDVRELGPSEYARRSTPPPREASAFVSEEKTRFDVLLYESARAALKGRASLPAEFRGRPVFLTTRGNAILAIIGIGEDVDLISAVFQGLGVPRD